VLARNSQLVPGRDVMGSKRKCVLRRVETTAPDVVMRIAPRKSHDLASSAARVSAATLKLVVNGAADGKEVDAGSGNLPQWQPAVVESRTPTATLGGVRSGRGMEDPAGRNLMSEIGGLEPHQFQGLSVDTPWTISTWRYALVSSRFSSQTGPPYLRGQPTERSPGLAGDQLG